jgi:hypothetical protein
MTPTLRPYQAQGVALTTKGAEAPSADKPCPGVPNLTNLSGTGPRPARPNHDRQQATHSVYRTTRH